MNEQNKVPEVSEICEQCCGAPTITAVRSGERLMGLCLRCWKEFDTIQGNLFERNVRALNHNAALLDHMAGMPAGFTPRYQLPTQRYQTIIGDIALNNIKIDRSAIGILNTGTISGSLEKIDASIQILKNDPQLQQIQKGLQQLTEALISAADASTDQKEEMLELLSALSNEVLAASGKPRGSVIRSLLHGIGLIATCVDSIEKLWEKVKSLFESCLGQASIS